MEIRRMNLSHYDEVYLLWSATDGMGMRSLDDSKNGISKFIERNPRTNFVAVDNNQIIGVILCGHDGRRGYIYHTAVKSTNRGQGIGKALVEQAVQALEAEGITKAALVAFKTNHAGNGFWESIGFEERGDLVYRNRSLNQNNQ